MILGNIIPLILFVIAIAEVPLFLRWYSDGRMAKGAAYAAMALSLVLPIIAYAVLNFAMPELGAKEFL